MKSLREHLEELDRKERNAIIRKVFKTETIQMSEEFISELERKLSITIPQDYYWALDYHIDWIYAALHLFYGKEQSYNPTKIYHTSNNLNPQFNQEDSDLLIYFNQYEKHNFIFIEAKYDTPWLNHQFQSKNNRLASIKEKFKSKKDLNFYYILLSPSNPQNLKDNNWPWIKMAKKSPLYTISRCTEDGKKSVNGTYWNAFKIN